MTDALQSWSSWIPEGHFISYVLDGFRYYEHVLYRDLAHYEYNWPQAIAPGVVSGPYVPDELEITRGYNDKTGLNWIWQMIFGIRSQAYIYIEMPTDTHRHGLPKIAKPSSAERQISHFEEWMSPFYEPSFITEHFFMRPITTFIGFDGYNNESITLRDIRLNIFINKLITERIGYTEPTGVQTPYSARWAETLDKLYRRVIPQRPITLTGVQMPSEAPGGE